MLTKVFVVACFVLAVQAFAPFDSNDEETSNLPAVLSRTRRSCGPAECNAHCRRLGHARGVCIGTYCQCRSRLARSVEDNEVSENALETVVPTNEEVSEDEVNPEALERRADCNLRACEQSCRRIGFPGGACVNGRCKCDILRSAAPEALAPLADEEEGLVEAEPQPRACNILSCARACASLGFRFAQCRNSRCYCWN